MTDASQGALDFGERVALTVLLALIGAKLVFEGLKLMLLLSVVRT